MDLDPYHGIGEILYADPVPLKGCKSRFRGENVQKLRLISDDKKNRVPVLSCYFVLGMRNSVVAALTFNHHTLIGVHFA